MFALKIHNYLLHERRGLNHLGFFFFFDLMEVITITPSTSVSEATLSCLYVVFSVRLKSKQNLNQRPCTF